MLRLKKSFKTATSPVENADGDKGVVRLFDDMLDTLDGRPRGPAAFAWHINPSTRPIVAKAQGARPPAAAEPAVVTTGNPPPLPPCPTYFEAGAASCAAGGLDDRVFTVPTNSPTRGQRVREHPARLDGSEQRLRPRDLQGQRRR